MLFLFVITIKKLCERKYKRCYDNYLNASASLTYGLRREFRIMRLKERREEVKISENPTKLYPKKMILKHGVKHFLLDVQDIVYCYSFNKIVYVIDANDQKYIYDKNLLSLEKELDPRLFFKINRTHIINFNFIRSFVMYDRNKMKIELKNLQKDQTVVISQTRVNAFKEWIYQQL